MYPNFPYIHLCSMLFYMPPQHELIAKQIAKRLMHFKCCATENYYVHISLTEKRTNALNLEQLSISLSLKNLISQRMIRYFVHFARKNEMKLHFIEITKNIDLIFTIFSTDDITYYGYFYEL